MGMLGTAYPRAHGAQRRLAAKPHQAPDAEKIWLRSLEKKGPLVATVAAVMMMMMMMMMNILFCI